MSTRRAFLSQAAILAGVALAPAGRAGAADAIKIGDINSYSALPDFTIPYRMGWQLALRQINERGGVLGRPLDVVSRDDGGRPGDAVTAANELYARERVALLMGTFFSNVGLAVSDFARQRRILFVAAEPLSDALTLQAGNRYTFRLRPSTSMQAAMLVDDAADLPAVTWASIAPNYEYGQSAVEAFRTLLQAKRPDVRWVAEQWPPLGKIDAGPTVQALENARPDAIFNVTFGPDLVNFVREGNTRGLFEGRSVVSLLTGEPEYLDPLRSETPEGWIVTGYPWSAIQTPEHDAFAAAYRDAYDDYPRLGSVVGHATMTAVAAIIAAAGSTDTDRMIEAATAVTVDTPFGPVRLRDLDHQSTMGTFVGRTALAGNQGVMTDWRYADGADYLPPPEMVKALRPPT
jgi:branched-chain amino acid transport system substrate-binding protein